MLAEEKDLFYSDVNIKIKPFCYSPLDMRSGLPKEKAYIVAGIVVKIAGHVTGVFKGSRVIALCVVNESIPFDIASIIDAKRENVIAISENITFANACASAKYLCKINEIREAKPFLGGTYALTANDTVFIQVLDTIGYRPVSIDIADLIIDTDNTVDRELPLGRKLVKWKQKFENGMVKPGADWPILKNSEKQYKLKYAKAFVQTTFLDNFSFYVRLINKYGLIPDTSDVTIIREEESSGLINVDVDLSLFKPYEHLILKRTKPMVIVYKLNKKMNKLQKTIDIIDSWVGYKNSFKTEAFGNIKVGYPDGSIADIIVNDAFKDQYIEIHFNGNTIIFSNGITKKY